MRAGGGGVAPPPHGGSLPVPSLACCAHLFGRGGPPAGLPCGSHIPTYSSFGVLPLSARGGTSITMCWPALRVRGACWGGGGGACAGPVSGLAPFLLGGEGAAKGLLRCCLVSMGNQPTACTLALWWLKFGPTEFIWGGGGAAVAFSDVRLRITLIDLCKLPWLLLRPLKEHTDAHKAGCTVTCCALWSACNWVCSSSYLNRISWPQHQRGRK